MLLRPTVAANLLYLGIAASLICYWTWNMVIRHLGAIRATNYLYLNPIGDDHRPLRPRRENHARWRWRARRL